jgi:hypothetical protein
MTSPVRDHPDLYIARESQAQSVPRLLNPQPSDTRDSAWRTFLRWLAKHRR